MSRPCALLRKVCRKNQLVVGILGSCLVGALGCGGGDGAATDAAPSATDADVVDGGPSADRGFFMASAGVQANLGDSLFNHAVPVATLAADSDVIEIHEEFLGIPWAEFEAGVAPPAEWVAEIDKIATPAKASGKPIFLNVLAGRDYLTPRAVIVDGQLDVEEHWSAPCFNFATADDGPAKKAAYVRYVEWMVDRFEPRWFNIGIEINLFHQTCPLAWDGMVDVERAAYDAVKARSPATIVFPSFALGQLYGFECEEAMREQCYNANYAALAGLKRDRFAVSTYPYLQEFAVEDVPSDWFTRAADREGETVIISETGWNSQPAIARLGDQCLQGVSGSAAEQSAYLQRLAVEGAKDRVEMFVWWSNSDLLPAFVMGDCPCDDNTDWCAVVDVFRSTGGGDPVGDFTGELLLKIWGGMGLRDHAGTPKQPIYSEWETLRDTLPPPP